MIRLRRVFLALCTAALCTAALAQESNEDQPPDPDTGESTLAERTLGVLPNPYLRDGVKYTATYIGEVIGNPTGGLRQGVVTQGRLNLAVDIDFQKLVHWNGLIAHANIFGIHGGGLSRNYVGNFLVTSGIEALPALRLYEAYFEQKFFNDQWSVRFGQFAADSEFLATKYTDVFTNASLGWPAITSIDLPSGGPSPPLAAVGLRVFGKLSEHLSWLTAVFNGDPAGPGANDPQQRNRNGLNFRVNDPPLVLSEVQVSWKSLPGNAGLPGTVKFGGWHHFGSFSDQRLDDGGRSLADPLSSGTARRLRSDDGIYLVAEQRLLTLPHDDNRGIGVFLRISGSPADRNLIDRYADAGVDFLGLKDSRPHDKFGIAVGYAHVSRRAQALDRDYLLQNGLAGPIRTSEALLTMAYQYEAVPGWNMIPNVQLIKRPGGGATDPLGPFPGRPLRDAAVLGLRSVLKF